MKIFCIGRNYSLHAQELGNESPEEPVIFMKPDSALLRQGEPFFIPSFSNEVHYETEVVIKINRLGKAVEERFAHRYYNEFTIGIDFTARDLQSRLKAKGLPWELAKGFDGSAVIGKWLNKDDFDLNNLDFGLKLNNQQVQKGNTSHMLFSIDKIIAFISQYYTLKIGDLIYTGTPEGVGKVSIGDLLEGFVNDLEIFKVKVK
jgi:2-keto-4-pentenoate hydratase/2-oxohepta-3-ene-1,7-dioic acid hydratase in catechol pathway